MSSSGRLLSTKTVTEAQLINYDVVSTDLFDTLLIRDFSSERLRFEEAAYKAARRARVHPERLSALRRSFHGLAYKAVAAERPLGDVSLALISKTVAAAIGRGEELAKDLQKVEVETDIRHLAPNLKLVSFFEQLARAGKRIIAITDTYYTETDIRKILDSVIGPHPIAHIYASCDIGLTKHSGALFAEVIRRENVSPNKIVHIGDDSRADIMQAQANGLDVVHLPRSAALRRAGKLAFEITRGRSKDGSQP